MQEKNQIKKILIIDNNTEGLELLLSSFNFKVDLATNGKEGLRMLSENSYDLSIISFCAPLVDGLNLLEAIRNDDLLNFLPVIIISTEGSVENQVESLKKGADDYLEKPFEITNLVARIESLLRRISWYDNRKSDLPNILNGRNKEDLTSRQVEILSLMSHGYSNKQMANRLFLSETTIKAHLRGIFKKLKVANRTQAVLVGINHGLIA